MIIAPAVAPPRFIAAESFRSRSPIACCTANEPMVAAWPQLRPGFTSRPSRSLADRPASSSARRIASTAKPTALGPYTLPCSVMPKPAIAVFARSEAMCAFYGSDACDLKPSSCAGSACVRARLRSCAGRARVRAPPLGFADPASCVRRPAHACGTRCGTRCGARTRARPTVARREGTVTPREDRIGTSPLRFRDFRLMWAGFFVSQVGTQMQVVAVAWQVYQLTGDPLALGAIGLARVLPVARARGVRRHVRRRRRPAPHAARVRRAR